MRGPSVWVAIASVVLAACSQRARSNDLAPRLMVPELPRAGVRIEPVARHGGMVMLSEANTVEMVVEPSGEVRVYPRDADDNDVAPGAARGRVLARFGDGSSWVAGLVPDAARGALVGWMPAPRGSRTEYDVTLDVEQHSLHTGIAVLQGGTAPTLAFQRSQGDQRVIPDATDITLPSQAPPPTAVGGGPRSSPAR